MRPELGKPQELLHARGERASAEPVEPSVEGDDLFDAQAPEERGVSARHVEPTSDRAGLAREVVTEDRGPPAVRHEEGGQDRQECRLAGAVRAEHADDRAALNRQGDAAKRVRLAASGPAAPERLGEVVGVDREHRSDGTMRPWTLRASASINRILSSVGMRSGSF